MISATKKWIFLKVSSVVLVPLMLWFLFNLVSFYDKSYQDVILFFTSQPSKLLFSLSHIKKNILIFLSLIAENLCFLRKVNGISGRLKPKNGKNIAVKEQILKIRCLILINCNQKFAKSWVSISWFL